MRSSIALKKYIFLTLLTGICFSLKSQNVILKSEGKEFYNGQNQIISLPLDRTSFNTVNHKVTSANIYIQLDMGEDFIVKINGDEEVSFDVVAKKVDGQNETLPLVRFFQGTSELSSVEYELSIDQTSPRRIAVIDATDIISSNNGLNRVEVDFALLTNQEINNRVRLKAWLEVEIDVDVRGNNGNMLASCNISGLNSPSQPLGRFVNFQWSTPDNINFPNYELQILRLYNTDPSKKLQNIIKTEVDWSEALRIETQSARKSLSLSMTQGTGFYLWRVRPIGSFYKGGIANSENYGQWSSAPNNGEIIELNKSSLSLSSAFFVNDPDEEINYMFTRAFTDGDQEGVKVKEGINYADPLLNMRQSQVQVGSDNDNQVSSEEEILVSQVVLDYSGRPSLETVPVPVRGMLDGFKPGFVHVKNEAGDKVLYTALNFDTDDKVEDPDAVNDNSESAFQYYSNEATTDVNNTFVSDAEGYTYSRTVFSTDGLSRAKEVSGMGKIHALGAISDGKGRTNKIFYATPSPEELIRIFHDEAPNNETVEKTIEIDANNIATITYTSIQGKVIATAIKKVDSNTFDELDSYSRATTEEDEIDENHDDFVETFEINNKSEVSVLQNGGLYNQKRYTFIEEKEVKLSYKYNPETSDCVDNNCNYSVRFNIYDINADKNFSIGFLQIQNGLVDFNEAKLKNDQGVDVGTEFSLTPVDDNKSLKLVLKPGEYIISKMVVSGFSTSLTTSDNEAVSTLMEIIFDRMEAIQNEEQQASFELMIQNISSGFQTNASAASIFSSIDGYVYSGEEFPDGFMLNIPETGFGFNVNPGGCNNCADESGVAVSDKCVPCDLIREYRESFVNGTDDEALFKSNIENIVALHFIGTRGPDVEEPEEEIQINNAITLRGKLFEEDIEDYFIAEFAPGFTYRKLGYLLKSMLTSKYYLGSKALGSTIKSSVSSEYFNEINVDVSQINDDVWYKIDFNENNQMILLANELKTIEEDIEFVYSDDDLERFYSCWVGAVDLLKSQKPEMSDPVMHTYNSNTGTEPDDGSKDESDKDGSSDSQANDDDNSDRSLIMDWIINRKLRQFEREEGGSNGKKVVSVIDLPKTFLSCVGTRYFGIIDDSTVPGSDQGIYDDFYETTSFTSISEDHGLIEYYLELFIDKISGIPVEARDEAQYQYNEETIEQVLGYSYNHSSFRVNLAEAYDKDHIKDLNHENDKYNKVYEDYEKYFLQDDNGDLISYEESYLNSMDVLVPVIGTKFVPAFTDENGKLIKIEDTESDGFEISYNSGYYPSIVRPELMFKYYNYNANNTISANSTDNILSVITSAYAGNTFRDFTFVHLNISQRTGFFESVGNIFGNDRDQPDYFDFFYRNDHFGLINNTGIELESCYNIPTSCSASIPSCISSCEFGHETWNVGQRINFYQMIQNPKVYFPVLDDAKSKDISCSDFSQARLDAMANAKFDRAINMCGARKIEIKREIMAMLDAAGYTLVECLSEPQDPQNKEYTIHDITAAVNASVEACKNRADIDIRDYFSGQTTVIDGEVKNYPFCQSYQCYFRDEATGACSAENYSEPKLFILDDCTELNLEQMSVWKFKPFLVDENGNPIDESAVSPAEDKCAKEAEETEIITVEN